MLWFGKSFIALSRARTAAGGSSEQAIRQRASGGREVIQPSLAAVSYGRATAGAITAAESAALTSPPPAARAADR